MVLREQAQERRFVVPNPEALAAVSADFATLTVTPELAVHSVYQTRLPAGLADPNESVDCVLVGRFVYGPETLKSLVALFVRQLVTLEAARGRREETLKWLNEQVQKLQAR